jgi:hypothetical protein
MCNHRKRLVDAQPDHAVRSKTGQKGQLSRLSGSRRSFLMSRHRQSAAAELSAVSAAAELSAVSPARLPSPASLPSPKSAAAMRRTPSWLARQAQLSTQLSPTLADLADRAVLLEAKAHWKVGSAF